MTTCKHFNSYHFRCLLVFNEGKRESCDFSLFHQSVFVVSYFKHRKHSNNFKRRTTRTSRKLFYIFSQFSLFLITSKSLLFKLLLGLLSFLVPFVEKPTSTVFTDQQFELEKVRFDKLYALSTLLSDGMRREENKEWILWISAKGWEGKNGGSNKEKSNIYYL